MGHETMGIVESVGPDVTSIKPGDRVVVAFDIACGGCAACKALCFSGCDNTNPSKEQEMLVRIPSYMHYFGTFSLYNFAAE